MKERPLSPDSWRSPSTTVTSGSLRAMRSRAGISWRHGTHQVAQKFTITTPPRRSDRRVDPPEPLHVKFGAGAPTRPAAAASSICAAMTGTSPSPAPGRVNGSDGQTSAVSEARAIAPMKIAAIQRGSATEGSAAAGAGGRCPPICSPKERQEVEELGQLRELPGGDDQAHHDDERTADRVHDPQVLGEETHRAARAAQAAGDEQERDAETERVREEEDRAGAEVRVEQQVEDQREVGSDAGREPHAERDPDEEAPCQPRRAALEPQIELARKERDADEPEHLHPKDDEEEPADPLEPDDELAGERARERDRHPEEREDHGETDHERGGVQERARAL